MGLLKKPFFTSENNKSGIKIIDGRTKGVVKIGLGVEFEEMGDSFDWVDYWGLVTDAKTYEILIKDSEIIGDTIINLENKSIVLRKEEVGGGLVSFLNGKYQWIHQAD